MQVNDIINFDENFNEYVKFCNENNYIIKELGNGKYQIVQSPTNNIEDQIIELKNWFSDTYGKKEEKFRRLNTMYNIGLLSTEEAKNAYSNLIALYNEAEDKRKRIQELEVLINAEI